MAEIMEDKTKTKVSLFEQRVLFVVKLIIVASLLDVLIIFLVQGIARKEFTTTEIQTLILTCLSIIVASIPVALPLVLQVTMALGAGKMARDFSAVVTSLPALQDISSMSVLCSDKTGTYVHMHDVSLFYFLYTDCVVLFLFTKFLIDVSPIHTLIYRSYLYITVKGCKLFFNLLRQRVNYPLSPPCGRITQFSVHIAKIIIDNAFYPLHIF